jgi:uroporphyrinogen III methyltransferase/synthase
MKPLAGRRIVITRRREQAGPLRRLLERHGACAIELPTIALTPPESFGPLDRALKDLAAYDWILFTSANGVERFFARMSRRRVRKTVLKKKWLAAIGPATAAALRRQGFRAHVIPEDYRAEGLVAALAQERWHGKRVLLARAAEARQLLPRALRRRGARVDVVAVYRTVAPERIQAQARKLFGRRRPDAITFTSSSTVRNFFALLGARRARRALRGVAVATIGPVTSRTARALGLRVAVQAGQYTMSGLVAALENYFHRHVGRG